MVECYKKNVRIFGMQRVTTFPFEAKIGRIGKRIESYSVKMKEGKERDREVEKEGGWNYSFMARVANESSPVSSAIRSRESPSENLFALRVAHAFQKRTSASRFARVCVRGCVCVRCVYVCVHTCMYVCACVRRL